MESLLRYLLSALIGLGCAWPVSAESKLSKPLLNDPASKPEPVQLILELSRKSGERTLYKVELFGDVIDPNRSHGKLNLKVDGKKVEIPEPLLARLHRLRRDISYDSQSGGITVQPSTSRVRCLMAGNAEGFALKALYLKLDKVGNLEESVLRDVYGQPENCLFNALALPNSRKAVESARAIVEIMNSIYVLRK